MNAQTDQQLLRDYAGSRSEAAFAELVRRHIDLVYSAALRMVSDSHLAEDVTQGVFVALAQNARQLTQHPVLSGWLHRTTQNLAANAVRTNVRRQTREQEAVAMNELLSAETDTTWENIAPHLDAALGELNEPDRDALLLRYFERKSAREIAQTLGISDEAAQKRMSRAVERLREFFAKRGVTVGVSGLVVVISANAVQAAPVGLAVTISTAAALTGATVATTATATAVKTIAMTTLQKTIIGVTLAVAIGTGVFEAQQATKLREQNQLLQQRQSPLAAQLQQLMADFAEATNRLASVVSDNERLNRNSIELLKLRNEVRMLRDLTNEVAQSRNSPLQENINQNHTKYYFRNPVPVAPPVDFGLLRAIARFRLHDMDERLNLSSEQRTAIEAKLTDPSSTDPEGDIAMLLSPEQRSVYKEIKQKAETQVTRIKSEEEVDRYERGLALTYEQKTNVFSVIYELDLAAKLARLDEPPVTDPKTMWAQDLARESKMYERKLNALTNILSVSQLENLRQWQADDMGSMLEQVKKLEEQLTNRQQTK